MILLLFLLQVPILLADSNLVSTNTDAFTKEIFCDLREDLCETHITANLTLSSSNMAIILGDTNQSIFFDQISLKYSITADSPYTLYDGDFIQENATCLCNTRTSPEDICRSTSDFRQSPDGFKAIFAGPPDLTVCNNPEASICCRRVYLANIHRYRVYKNLTSRFESLQFSYKKKFYSMSFSSSSLQLLDVNFTWTGGEQWTFPTDNLALLVNQDNKEVISVLSSTLNGPQEYSIDKSGWWHGTSQTRAWMSNQSVSNTPYSYNLSIPRVSKSNIADVTRIECGDPGTPNREMYTSVVKRAIILGANSSELEYFPEIPEERNMTVTSLSGNPLTICVSYPYICVCDNSVNRCLDTEAFIVIFDTTFSLTKYAYIKGQFLFQTPVCATPNFLSFKNPLTIRARIESKDFIPKYRMSDCTYEWNLLTTTNISLISDCVLLPCKLTDNTGNILDINLTKTQTFVTWPKDDFTWINLTCGGHTSEQKSVLNTGPTQEEIEFGDGSLDPVQYLIWGLLTAEFGGTVAFISWSVFFTLFAICLNNLGKNKTIILFISLLICLWVSGVAFVIIIFGLLSYEQYRNNPQFLRNGRFQIFTPKPQRIILPPPPVHHGPRYFAMR